MTILPNKSLLQVLVLVLISLICFQPRNSAATGQSRKIDPGIREKIDDFIETVFLPSSQIAGLGLTIVHDDGELLYTTGYGLANNEKGIRVANSTQFLLGSLTKSFTALLVVKLLHENFPNLGETVLDTPIMKLLPQANFTLVDQFRSEQATFRDLLSHRLCLPREDYQILADPFDTVEEIAYRTRYIKEVCGMRGGYQYSNQMYVMLGQLVGILAGKPYQDAMRDLLSEIGMTNTSFVQQTDDFSKMPFRAMPHYIRDNETHPFNPELVKRVAKYAPAGGLFISPDAMSKYMRFHLNLGSIDGREIVPRTVMEWLRTPSNLMHDFTYKTDDDDLILNDLGYGLALILSSYDGWASVQHGGNFIPYSCQMSLYPAKKLGIFTGINSAPFLMHQKVLHAFIFELLNGNQNPAEKVMKLNRNLRVGYEFAQIDTKIGLSEVNQKFKKDELSLSVNQLDIVGKYGSGSMGDVQISRRLNSQTNNTQYYFGYGRWYTGWLEETAVGELQVYRFLCDTDAVQDNYTMGFYGDSLFISIDGKGTLTMFAEMGGGGEHIIVRGVFKRGVRLDTLPPVPWRLGDKCEPGHGG